jgi:hypothetical protein
MSWKISLSASPEPMKVRRGVIRDAPGTGEDVLTVKFSKIVKTCFQRNLAVGIW